MSGFATPTLAELRAQLRSAIAGRLGTDPALRRSLANILADAMAGVAHGEYRYLANMAANLLPDLAGGDYIERWARILGIVRTGAVAAAGNAVFTGTSGVEIPAGTALLASDGVTEFTTNSLATLAAGTATVAVTATTPGAAGNLGAGAVLSLVAAIAGVDPAAALDASGTTGGADTEADESLRARVLYRLREPPAGGSAMDYIAWMKAQPGVTRAWVYPLYFGAGTVTVAFMMDGRADPFPDSPDIAGMQAVLDVLRPVTAEVTVEGLAVTTVNITITDLVPDTADTRAAIAAELADLFARAATPGDASSPELDVVYGDGVDADNPAGFLARSRIVAAIQNAAGVASFTLSVPSADVQASTLSLPVLGTITYA